MAVKNKREVFTGKRRRLNVLGIVLSILAVLVVALVVLFYSFQKYIIYDQGGIKLVLPLSGDSGTANDDGARSFETVSTELVFADPDYSALEAEAGEDLADIRALFVPAESVSREGVDTYIGMMEKYNANALVLDLKPVSGQLVWKSNSEVAASYGTNGTLDLADLANYIKTQDIYLAGQLSCCTDALMGERASSCALKNGFSAIYTDAEGVWLDPFNPTVRQYIGELCQELSDLGFDEVILKNASMPLTDQQLVYTVQLSFTPTPTTAVCGLARSITQALSYEDIAVSAILDSESYRGGQSDLSGQDLTLFGKVFDRFYCTAGTAWQYGIDLDTAKYYLRLGSLDQRFVPIMSYAPEDTTSYTVRVPDALVG